MSKQLLFSFLIFNFSLSIVVAQNLVPNPSFEDTLSCPDSHSQIEKAIGWKIYYESPDLYHSCSSDEGSSAPKNIGGYQQPATGNAYAGIFTYGIREVLGCGLVSNLEIGRKYYLEFKLNMLFNPDLCINYGSTNKTGFLFSTNEYSVSTSGPFQLNNFSHFYSTNIITDTLNWTSVYAEFIADSAYQYLYIGNFFDDYNTDTLTIYENNIPGEPNVRTDWAYYFIDDIYVSETPLSVNEHSLQANVAVYPTIVEHQFFIALNELHNKECSISIYNALGMEIQTIKNPNESIITFNTNGYAKGMYFVKIEANKKVITKKIIVK